MPKMTCVEMKIAQTIEKILKNQKTLEMTKNTKHLSTANKKYNSTSTATYVS
mgnify:CR=1 FL=1